MSTSGVRGALGLPPELDEGEKAQALADPGPTWKEWFFRSFLKVWTLLFFFIADAWIVAIWVFPLDPWPILPSLVGATYLEFLGYQYLWHQPELGTVALPSRFHRTWLRPVYCGRWTAEAALLRAGASRATVEGLDAKEFL